LALALSFLLHWSATRYDREGIQAEAEILDTWARVTENTDGGTTTTHYIRFLFRVRGDRHEVERSVSRAYFSRVSDGDVVPIRYLESDPDRFEYEVGTNSRWANRLWFATLLPLGLGLGTHLWFRSATRQAIRVREEGERMVAVITEIRATGVAVNDERNMRLIWRTADGAVGQSLMHGENKLERYAPGGRVTVFRKGATMWWEGDVGMRR
ncbi:MAG: DUF3592 domain-containing protein, partial [Pseudomonadota bacterium]